ncbi:MAG: DNA polymerase I, partial [Chloroflexota bacterium]|nr:DNA polymerase I [Chloroflexota bacterium]
DYDRERVIELFRNLEFFSLLGKLPEATIEKQTTMFAESESSNDYKVVNTADALDILTLKLSASKVLAVDTETTSTDARHANLVGISLAVNEGEAWYVPVGHREGAQLPLAQVSSKLKPILEDSHIDKIAHNGKYDVAVLSKHGIELRCLAADTMIAAHLLGQQALGLKQLTFGRLGIEMTPISDLIGSGAKQISMDEVEIGRVAGYACTDADMTLRLNGLFETELKNEGLWKLFSKVEMPLVTILYRMERNGIALDVQMLAGMSQTLFDEMGKLEAEIYNWVGHQFNINSSQQLGKVLFDELKLPPTKKTKSGYSTNASVLEGLRGIHPIVGYILDYRQFAKLKSTYVDALPALVDPETGRVHTSFNQTVTATGRLSSSDPNLQNIPIRSELGKKIRQAFVAPGDDSVLLAADYSQIELRVMAHLSQDPGLLAAFSADEDIHTTTAAKVFGVENSGVTSDMRRIAKVVNFGVIYGMSDYGLEQATGLSRSEAAEFIRVYFQKYKGVVDYIETTKRQASEQGYVQTILGRRRYIPDIKSSNYQIRQAAERMAINMPVQGTAADIIKLAMIKIQNEMDARNLKSKMLLQVHDELLFEVPPEEIELMQQLVHDLMPKAMEFSVPLKIESKMGHSWGEME